MTFREQWFSDASVRALVKLFNRTRRLDGRIVEVGCWEGRSTCHLINAAWPYNVQAVDTWAGSPGEISRDLATTRSRNVYVTFEQNVAELTRGNVTVHREDWRSYFERDRTPIRFLHIDATHTYDEVADNIAAAVPLMVPGGIISGDDAHHPPVWDAAVDQLGSVNRDASLWWKEIR